MAEQSLVVYDKFSGGEYGALDGLSSPPNSWTGRNLLVTRNGELCVRPGLKDVTPASVAVGIIRGMGYYSVTTAPVWYCVGTTFYSFDPVAGGAISNWTGTIASTPTFPMEEALDAGGISYITNFADKSYKLDHNARTVTALTASKGGRTICIYDNTLVVGGIGTGLALGNRIQFSTRGDYTTWPAANFADLPSAWQIRGLYPQRTHLLIETEDGSWFVITGTLGVDAVLRRVYGGAPLDPNVSNQGPYNPTESVLMPDGTVMFLSGSTLPGLFTGSTSVLFRHLYAWGGASSGTTAFPPGVKVQKLGLDDEVGFFGSSKGLIRHEGAWAIQNFGVTTDAWVTPIGIAPGSGLVISDGGAAGSAAKFYGLSTYLDRPGFEGNTMERAGDNSSTQLAGNVTFPDYWAKAGEQIAVRGIIVDFKKWNTGGATTNHFDVTVTAMRQRNTPSEVTSVAQSFDEAGSSSSTTGTRDSEYFGFGDQGMGSGFRIAFSAMRGIAIEKVHVVGDVIARRDA